MLLSPEGKLNVEAEKAETPYDVLMGIRNVEMKKVQSVKAQRHRA